MESDKKIYFNRLGQTGWNFYATLEDANKIKEELVRRGLIKADVTVGATLLQVTTFELFFTALPNSIEV